MKDRRSDKIAFTYSISGTLIIMVSTLARYSFLSYARVFIGLTLAISVVFLIKDIFQHEPYYNNQNIARIIGTIIIFGITFLPFFEKYFIPATIENQKTYVYTVNKGIRQYRTDSVSYSEAGVSFIASNGKEYTLSNYEVVKNKERK